MALASPSPVDWPTRRTQVYSFTGDQLLQYNAAGVDPYTVQVAELVGGQLQLSRHGQRNLATALASLPQAEYPPVRLGIGFADTHIVRVLAATDGGFVFVGVCGCLAEYYTADVVVAVLVQILEDWGIDPGAAPSEAQWAKLVQLCQGALATSPFGVLVTESDRVVAPRPTGQGHAASIRAIVDGLVGMSDVIRGHIAQITVDAGGDAPWFAAVATYLFGLRTAVSPGGSAEGAQVLLHVAAAPRSTDANPSTTSPGPAASLPATSQSVTGGRVPWDQLFRTCFGRAYTDIDPKLIAEFLGGSASLTTASLHHDQTSSQAFFLPQPSAVPGLSGFGLVETLTSWFPEFRKLQPVMDKVSRWPFQQARDRMDDISAALDAACMCGFCGNASPDSTEFCKHTIVEVMMSLGLFIARTVVVPSLYPKKAGVLAYYRRYHAGRMAYEKSTERFSSPEAFFRHFTATLPTPRTMIETMILLFAGVSPPGMTDTTVAMASAGLLVSLTAWKPQEREQPHLRHLAGVSVNAGTAHFCGRVFTHGYFVPAFPDANALGFRECFELLRTQPRAIKPVMRRQGDQVLFSYVKRDDRQEQRAPALGWLVMD